MNPSTRYRWLDSEKPVLCTARNSPWKGNTGHLLVLPIPGRMGNCLVRFEQGLSTDPRQGVLVVCNAGGLKNLKQPDAIPKVAPEP